MIVVVRRRTRCSLKGARLNKAETLSEQGSGSDAEIYRVSLYGKLSLSLYGMTSFSESVRYDNQPE